jgi:hypothetical protein
MQKKRLIEIITFVLKSVASTLISQAVIHITVALQITPYLIFLIVLI